MPEFGTRQLPPHEVLPEQVSAGVEQVGEAQARALKLKAQLGNARRVELPQAKRRDVEASADELAKGKAEPPAEHEHGALGKIVALERSTAAAELLERRAREHLDEQIEAHAEQIGKAASERLSKARASYLTALDDLERAVGDLTLARALSSWASDPGATYKVRGLPPVPVPQHGSDPDIGSVLAALRQLLKPPRRPAMPSPFGAPASEPIEGEPASAPAA